MLPLAHSILLVGLYVAVLPGVPFAPIQALASPVPMPHPLMTVDYSHHNVTTARTSDSRTKHSFAFNHTHPFPMASKPISARDFDIFNGYVNKASGHAAAIKDLAARSSLVHDDDFDFQHACAYRLTGFQTNFLGFQTLLDGDKGLAYYNRSDELERMIKEIINLNKDVFTYTDVLVHNIPVLGPILGPIVYEIKCLLDDLLNWSENLADASLNILEPLLKATISKASFTCGGLCL